MQISEVGVILAIFNVRNKILCVGKMLQMQILLRYVYIDSK